MEQTSAGGDSCFAQFDLEQIILQLTLGQSLKRSESMFAALPGEVVQLHIARHVRVLFMQDLGSRGLLTPVEAICLTCLAPSAVSREPPVLARRVNVVRRAVRSTGLHANPGEGADSWANMHRFSMPLFDFANRSGLGGESDEEVACASSPSATRPLFPVSDSFSSPSSGCEPDGCDQKTGRPNSINSRSSW
jgi:hypothetical protein